MTNEEISKLTEEEIREWIFNLEMKDFWSNEEHFLIRRLYAELEKRKGANNDQRRT